jgi:hypothetical protein
MFKLLVFFILVFFVYRWYSALKRAVKTRREPPPPPPRRFDISRVEEAEFRDLSDDNGSAKK